MKDFVVLFDDLVAFFVYFEPLDLVLRFQYIHHHRSLQLFINYAKHGFYLILS